MNMHTLTGLMKAVALAYIAVFVLMAAMNAILCGTADPDALIVPMAYGAFLFGAAASGLAGALLTRSAGQPAALRGLIAGAVYLAVVFVISLFFEGDTPWLHKLLLYPAGLALAAGTGYLAGRRDGRRASAGRSRRSMQKRIERRFGS